MTVPAVLFGLLEDAALAAGVDAEAAVLGHCELRRAPAAPLLGPLAVPDRRMGEVSRAAGEDPVSVTVINTSGAGGLLGLADRAVPGLQVTAVESALRDLDDLAGNAARVVAAARQLDPWEVYVEIPYAPGWERAVGVVEAGGLHAAVRPPASTARGAFARLAEQLSVLIESDVPFKTTGAGLSPLGVLAAVEALVDGATVLEAGHLLLTEDQALAALVRGWDDHTAGRVRRRLRLVACPSVPDAAADLAAAGVVSAA